MTFSRAVPGAAVLCLCVALSGTARAEDWPQFRGPTGLGYAADAHLPLNWGGKDRENVLWAADPPGEGHASPIVSGGVVFTCTVTWGDKGDDHQSIPDHHVTCFSAADGKRLWDTGLQPGPWLRNDFRSGAGGGYAAPTPCTDGKHLYVAFGSAVIAALDFDGHVVWRKELVPYTFDVTVGSSPVLFGDTVILLCAMSHAKDSRLVAFDAGTGDVKWETKMPTIGFAHSTPVLIDVKGCPNCSCWRRAGHRRPRGCRASIRRPAAASGGAGRPVTRRAPRTAMASSTLTPAAAARAWRSIRPGRAM